MMSKSKFYHAGCPICVSAEQDIIDLIGKDKVELFTLDKPKNEFQKQSRKVSNQYQHS